MFTDVYKTIQNFGESTFRDRSSRFVGLAFPLNSEKEVRLRLESIRKKYFDATHHCYAFRLLPDMSVFRASDDGEPSGSAGRPILGQIQSTGITNVLIVVVRYYGGTKLGVPGLINAYRTAAAAAVQAAGICEKTIQEVYEVEFPYEAMNDVMKALRNDEVKQREQQFDTRCRLVFQVRKSLADGICSRLSKLEMTSVKYLKTC